jgi:uncharacterized membrane protein YphA (DoxX/SURF4 family)
MMYKLLGAAFAVAGADKLSGDEGYEEMFEDLGWSREAMGAAAMAEVAGGVLLALRSTRRIGALMLAGTSAALLASELREGRGKLAGPRGFLLAAALLALIAPDRA